MRDLISRLEYAAPEASANDLNGEWRLLAVLGEKAAYRSSPFFWAFRQATAKYQTPIAIPSVDVPAGGAIASAVYGITDSIPLYDIGPAIQTIYGLCSEVDGCPVPELSVGEVDALGDAPSDGAESSSLSPSDAMGTLESRVELAIGRNLFGAIKSPQSIMTTTCTAREIVPAGDEAQPAGAAADDAANATAATVTDARSSSSSSSSSSSASASGRRTSIDVELRVETTAAKQSTIAALLPQLDELLSFPTGDALDLLRPKASRVLLRTTYLTERYRISRPILDMEDAPLGAAGEPRDEPVFVYARA